MGGGGEVDGGVGWVEGWGVGGVCNKGKSLRRRESERKRKPVYARVRDGMADWTTRSILCLNVVLNVKQIHCVSER